MKIDRKIRTLLEEWLLAKQLSLVFRPETNKYASLMLDFINFCMSTTKKFPKSKTWITLQMKIWRKEIKLSGSQAEVCLRTVANCDIKTKILKVKLKFKDKPGNTCDFQMVSVHVNPNAVHQCPLLSSSSQLRKITALVWISVSLSSHKTQISWHFVKTTEVL